MIDGTVARITPCRAFLQLEDGRLGLVHISEVDRNYVKDVHDHLREETSSRRRSSRSRRTARSISRSRRCRIRRRPAHGAAPIQFEQMLKKFMRQSEERLVDYKRAVEHKRK